MVSVQVVFFYDSLPNLLRYRISNILYTFLVSSKLNMRFPSLSSLPNFNFSWGWCALVIFFYWGSIWGSSLVGSSLILNSVIPIRVNKNRHKFRLLTPPKVSPLSVPHTSQSSARSSARRKFSNSIALSVLHI